MKIQFVSDLHLEFNENRLYLAQHPLTVVGEVLLIAGDTAYLDKLESGENSYCQNGFWNWVAESKAEKKIVLTHHVPTGLCTAAEFSGSHINGAFTVELGNYIADSGIDYWIYSHSHRNIDAQIGDTLILSNQLGYVSHGEHLWNGFKPGRWIGM